MKIFIILMLSITVIGCDYHEEPRTDMPEQQDTTFVVE